MNDYYFCSLDVSSSNVGFSEFMVLNNTPFLHEIKNFHLDTSVEIYQRFDDLEKYLSYKKYKFVAMEDRLKSFFPGATNKNAILAISAANEIMSFIVHKLTDTIIKMHPNTWRKIANIPIRNKGLDIKQICIQRTIEHNLFKQFLTSRDTSVENIFPTRLITRGKNSGERKFVEGVADQADSFFIGISGFHKFSADFKLEK